MFSASSYRQSRCFTIYILLLRGVKTTMFILSVSILFQMHHFRMQWQFLFYYVIISHGSPHLIFLLRGEKTSLHIHTWFGAILDASVSEVAMFLIPLSIVTEALYTLFCSSLGQRQVCCPVYFDVILDASLSRLVMFSSVSFHQSRLHCMYHFPFVWNKGQLACPVCFDVILD